MVKTNVKASTRRSRKTVKFNPKEFDSDQERRESARFILDEIERAEKDHDETFKMKFKMFGSKNDSKFLSLTKKHRTMLKNIFRKELKR